MYLTPCNKCPMRSDCARHDEVVAGVRGLHLGSIKFQCDDYRQQFQPGDRVTVLLRPNELMKKDGEWFHGFMASGTVMGWKDRKVVVCIDEKFVANMVCGVEYVHQPDFTISHSIIRCWPDRIGHSGERVPLCGNCNKPIGREIEGWKCERYADTQTPCAIGKASQYAEV